MCVRSATAVVTWWRHRMETYSALLAICAGNSPVPGEFPSQRPVTRSFDVFFDLRPNKRLSKQSCGWWIETPPCSLWCQCNGQTWTSRMGPRLMIPKYVRNTGNTTGHVSMAAISSTTILVLHQEMSKCRRHWPYFTRERSGRIIEKISPLPFLRLHKLFKDRLLPAAPPHRGDRYVKIVIREELVAGGRGISGGVHQRFVH